MDMVSFGEDETKDTPAQRQARMKLRNVLENNLTTEQLTELIADLDAQELCGQLTRLHSEFLKAQCIVLNVSWGKDAIRETLNKAL